MKKWRIPVEWVMTGIITVEAETLSDAIKKFDEKRDEYPLPDGYYLEDSFQRMTCLDCEDQEDYYLLFQMEE